MDVKNQNRKHRKHRRQRQFDRIAVLIWFAVLVIAVVSLILV